MAQKIEIPNGFFTNDYSVFVNLEVPKSNELRKSFVENCGKILINTINKTLYKINFKNGDFAWHIN